LFPALAGTVLLIDDAEVASFEETASICNTLDGVVAVVGPDTVNGVEEILHLPTRSCVFQPSMG
jgi:hypothetical protein